MKVITELTNEMKANFTFGSFVYSKKDLPSKDEAKIGNVSVVSRYFLNIHIKTDLYIFDGENWCLYKIKDKIFESDNIERLGYLRMENGGLFTVSYVANHLAKGPEYLLIYTTEGDWLYMTENSRICRVYIDRPEYIIGYDENCKLTKTEYTMLIQILNTSTFNENGYTGWEMYLDDHRAFFGNRGCSKIPDYSLLEMED